MYLWCWDQYTLGIRVKDWNIYMKTYSWSGDSISFLTHWQDSVRKLFLWVFLSPKNELTRSRWNEDHEHIAKPSNNELLASSRDIIEVRVNHCVTDVHRVHNFRLFANGILQFSVVFCQATERQHSQIWQVYCRWKACLPGANKAYLLRHCLKSAQNF